MLNKWHYTACVAMAFFGGFWGNVLGNSFTNNFYSVYPSESRYWLVCRLVTSPCVGSTLSLLSVSPVTKNLDWF